MSLHAVLQRRFGVDKDDFTAVLVDFADRAGPLALVELEPKDYFGARQQSALRSLGASLAPLEARELHGVHGDRLMPKCYGSHPWLTQRRAGGGVASGRARSAPGSDG